MSQVQSHSLRKFMVNARLACLGELLSKYDQYNWIHYPQSMHDYNGSNHPHSPTKLQAADLTPPEKNLKAPKLLKMSIRKVVRLRSQS